MVFGRRSTDPGFGEHNRGHTPTNEATDVFGPAVIAKNQKERSVLHWASARAASSIGIEQPQKQSRERLGVRARFLPSETSMVSRCASTSILGPEGAACNCTKGACERREFDNHVRKPNVSWERGYRPCG